MQIRRHGRRVFMGAIANLRAETNAYYVFLRVVNPYMVSRQYIVACITKIKRTSAPALNSISTTPWIFSGRWHWVIATRSGENPNCHYKNKLDKDIAPKGTWLFAFVSV